MLGLWSLGENATSLCTVTTCVPRIRWPCVSAPLSPHQCGAMHTEVNPGHLATGCFIFLRLLARPVAAAVTPEGIAMCVCGARMCVRDWLACHDPPPTAHPVVLIFRRQPDKYNPNALNAFWGHAVAAAWWHAVLVQLEEHCQHLPPCPCSTLPPGRWMGLSCYNKHCLLVCWQPSFFWCPSMLSIEENNPPTRICWPTRRYICEPQRGYVHVPSCS